MYTRYEIKRVHANFLRTNALMKLYIIQNTESSASKPFDNYYRETLKTIGAFQKRDRLNNLHYIQSDIQNKILRKMSRNVRKVKVNGLRENVFIYKKCKSLSPTLFTTPTLPSLYPLPSSFKCTLVFELFVIIFNTQMVTNNFSKRIV